MNNDNCVNVAALFVYEDGVYSMLNNVQLWGIEKDARNYCGPYPVVAHPPCNLWGKFAIINYSRWGGEHNKPGNDGGCFLSALLSAREFGGVLEHPAFSKAWERYNIDKPKYIGWNKISNSEWVCEVWQSAYGHMARKRTWLFYSGLNCPHDLCWDRKPGTHQIGFRDRSRSKDTNKPTIYGINASSTPIKFRDELIKLAILSRNKVTLT